MVLADLLTMHTHFLMKPNPYIPNEQAEEANTKLVLAEAATILSVVSLSLSMLKVMPSITLNSAYKKFNVVQFVIAGGLFAYYGYELYRLKRFVPEEEFLARKNGTDRVVY